MKGSIKRVVTKATQSPMNALRWMVTLDCGHEQWVTQRTRPKAGKKLPCSACATGTAVPERRP